MEMGSAPVSGAVFGVLAEYIFPFRPGATIGEFTRYSQSALASWTAVAATPLLPDRLFPVPHPLNGPLVRPQFQKPILGNFNQFTPILAFLTPSPPYIFLSSCAEIR